MGFYDRLKSALSGTGATVRQIVPDAKQAASGEQLPYEATFGYVFNVWMSSVIPLPVSEERCDIENVHDGFDSCQIRLCRLIHVELAYSNPIHSSSTGFMHCS